MLFVVSCGCVTSSTKWTSSTVLLVNYFVAAHSAMAMVCATNADCHLIVTLVEILAMCPFIYRSHAPHTCWLRSAVDVRTFLVCCFRCWFFNFYFSSIFKFWFTSFSIGCASSFDLWAHSVLCQSHDCWSAREKTKFVPVKRKSETWNENHLFKGLLRP